MTEEVPIITVAEPVDDGEGQRAQAVELDKHRRMDGNESNIIDLDKNDIKDGEHAKAFAVPVTVHKRDYFDTVENPHTLMGTMRQNAYNGIKFGQRTTKRKINKTRLAGWLYVDRMRVNAVLRYFKAVITNSAEETTYTPDGSKILQDDFKLFRDFFLTDRTPLSDVTTVQEAGADRVSQIHEAFPSAKVRDGPIGAILDDLIAVYLVRVIKTTKKLLNATAKRGDTSGFAKPLFTEMLRRFCFPTEALYLAFESSSIENSTGATLFSYLLNIVTNLSEPRVNLRHIHQEYPGMTTLLACSIFNKLVAATNRMDPLNIKVVGRWIASILGFTSKSKVLELKRLIVDVVQASSTYNKTTTMGKNDNYDELKMHMFYDKIPIYNVYGLAVPKVSDWVQLLRDDLDKRITDKSSIHNLQDTENAMTAAYKNMFANVSSTYMGIINDILNTGRHKKDDNKVNNEKNTVNTTPGNDEEVTAKNY